MNTTAPEPIASFFNHYVQRESLCKYPTIPRWTDTPASHVPPEEYSIVLQPTELIIDFDCKNYVDDPFSLTGGKLLLENEVIKEWDLPDTRVVETPSGGHHFYYSIPPGKKVKQEQRYYGEMIDFLSVGSQVPGPWSVIKEGIYKLVIDKPIATLPEKFYNWLEKVSDDVRGRAAIDETEVDDPRDILRYEKWLHSGAGASVQGQHGDDQLVLVCMYGRDYGLSLETTERLINKIYNPRAVPMWMPSDIHQKCRSAYRSARGEMGSKSSVVRIDRDPLLQEAAPKRKPGETKATEQMKALRFHHLKSSYIVDTKGNLIPNHIINTRVILANEPHFADMFWWDSFRHTIRTTTQAWWRDDKSDELSQEDFLHIYDWLNSNPSTCGRYRCELQTVKHAVSLRAQQAAKHPLQSYLNDLTWDGIPRLENLLIDTCNSPDGKWSGRAIRKFLIGCVERAYNPGAKMDYILCLQGGQGLRKGMWIDMLGGEWSRSGELDPGDAGMAHKMLGTWIMELPEIDQVITKRDRSKIKAFITQKSDFYRKPYAPAPTDVPRTACFIATLNPTDLGWLEDETGHRRYWPVAVGHCDIEKLAEIRDQVFAEAVHYYRQGEKPFFNDPEDKAMETAAQIANASTEPWTQLLFGRLQDTDALTITDAYYLLGLTAREIGTASRAKVTRSLRELKFTYDNETASWIRPKIS